MPKKIKEDLPPIEFNDNKTIGERISELRKKRGLSQVELSKKLGIMRATLSDYELGRSRVFDEMITRLSIALDVVPGRLLGFKDNTNGSEEINLRYTKRIKAIETLPEHKKRMILRMIDDMVKANA